MVNMHLGKSLPGQGAGRRSLGTTASAKAERRRLFIDAYLTNGRIAYRAAIAAGYSPRTASSQAGKLLTRRDIADELVARDKELRKISGIDAERSYRELARIAYLDQKDLYTENGDPIPVHLLSDDARAAVESHDPERGIKTYDKLKALDMTMKHIGGYEKDNVQRREDIQVQIVLVGGKASDPRTDDTLTDVPYTSVQYTKRNRTDEDEPLW